MAFKRGQEVFRDTKPFIYFVEPNFRKVVCDWCLKMCENEGILKTCTKCKWVYYCDQTCQKEAWNSHHKSECKYLQKQNMPHVVKELFDGNLQGTQGFYLVLLKIILKLKNNGKEEFFQLPNGKKRYFADLMSNADVLRKERENTEWFKFCQRTFVKFKIWVKAGGAVPSFTEFFEIIGKWRTNAASLSAMNYDNHTQIASRPTHIASALYLGYSSLDHSCAPNAMWFNVGKEMVVRTVEDVEDLSEIRIEYIEGHKRSHERKLSLRENYFFDCKCVKCEDPNSDAKFSALKCKACPGWVNDSTMICSSCFQKLNLSDEELSIVEKYKNGTLPKCDPTMTIKGIRWTLEKYIKIFHPFHEIFQEPENVFPIPKIVSQSRKGCHDAMSLLLEIRKLKLDHHSAHLPQYHEYFTHLNIKISDAYFALRLFDNGEFHLTKAEEMIKVVYGEDHPYMQEFQKLKIDCQKWKMEQQFARASLT